MSDTSPIYFPDPRAFRQWLAEHHDTATELLVGYHKVGTAKPSMTWPESVDEALCYGWIDGVRRRVDDERYVIRFTPRKPNSRWSEVNIRRAAELAEQGRMQPAGLAAFKARKAVHDGYSYEQRAEAALDPDRERRFRDDAAAWAFFEAQAPSYRRTAIFWVVSAKREETRDRRLATLIADSRAGRRIAQLARPPRP